MSADRISFLDESMECIAAVLMSAGIEPSEYGKQLTDEKKTQLVRDLGMVFTKVFKNGVNYGRNIR